MQGILILVFYGLCKLKLMKTLLLCKLVAYLKVLSDQMILKLSVLVFGGGSEAAHHAHVPSLGKGPLVRRRRPLFLSFIVQHLDEIWFVLCGVKALTTT